MLHISVILAIYHDLTFTLKLFHLQHMQQKAEQSHVKWICLLFFIYLLPTFVQKKKKFWNRAYMVIYTDSAANWFLWYCTSSPLRQNIIASFIQTDSQARKYSTTDRCQPINFKMFQNNHFLLFTGQTIS